MAIWPFKRRRRPSQVNDAATRTALSEKAKHQPATNPTSVATSPPPPQITSSTSPVQRRGSLRKQRRASQQDQATPANTKVETTKKLPDPTNKENIPLRGHGSREDITALPITQRLDQSPHLRPVDLERPSIPYNFRPHSMSQTSVQRQEAIVKPQRPNTLHSKRSTNDYSTPPRRTSSKQSRKRDDQLREEEIRAMSAPIPIPKRPGDGPLRRDSKKMRGPNGRDSQVSLPPEGSIHSTMSGVMEQRGWEIGSFAVLSPRPHVRLSGTPQYVSSSLPPSSSGILYRIDSMRSKEKEKEKAPVARDTARKRRTVGQEADELDSTDLRAIMERDAKRKEKKQQERQEKLERKLRSREGRNRGDSDLRRGREAEEAKRLEGSSRTAVAEQIQARGAISPPTAVHPALRNLPPEEEPVPVGLGIGKAPPPVEPMDIDQQQSPGAQSPEPSASNTGTYLNYPPKGDIPQNPFTDAAQIPAASPRTEQPHTASGTSLPLETPMEEPEVRTAQAVRYSQASTPPLSPVYANRATSSATNLAEPRHRSIAEETSQLPRPPPIIPVERRSSDPPKEKRAGAWASLFRRGGTNLRKDRAASPSEFSFSNTSRESMRNQPLPAHLVDTQANRPPTVRSKSGTPVRTQSKFREDLPEMPISPPDSRNQSPDVTMNAAAAAAARRAGRSTPQPVDIPGRMRDSDRNDTPVSQTTRSPGGAMAASLASIDSEGEWLASSSAKRQSQQSGLSRSLSKRQAEFSASYEELGGDKDAEYFSQSRARKLSSPALMGASPDEESEEDVAMDTRPETPGAPLTVHASVRRRPTLVERNPRMKSREGLVTEFASAEVEGTPEGSTDDDEPDSPAPQLERATSIQYGSRHSRQFSAGSAKLLDVPSKRTSTPTPETGPGAFPQEQP